MKIKRIPVLPVILAALVVLVFGILWAGSGFQPFRSTEPPIQVRHDMYYQTRLSAQQPSTFWADRKSMRDHVPGTFPREGSMYRFKTWQAADSAGLRNPFEAPDMKILKRGKNRFLAFCATCHSPDGQDTTEVVRRGLQKPPNLAAANARSYSDARLFHVISAGQNIMSGYADKLRPEDRWAIVSHIRELQKAPLKYPDIAVQKDSSAADSTKTGEGS